MLGRVFVPEMLSSSSSSRLKSERIPPTSISRFVQGSLSIEHLLHKNQSFDVVSRLHSCASHFQTVSYESIETAPKSPYSCKEIKGNVAVGRKE